jgi:hypothetical protein
MEKVTIQGVELTLSQADDHVSEWVDYHEYARQLEASWVRLSDVEWAS